MAHQMKEPESLRLFAPDCPDGLSAVVAKLMSKKPEDRYRGADEVAEALEPFLGEYFSIATSSAASAIASPTPPPRAMSNAARSSGANLPNPTSGAFNARASASTMPSAPLPATEAPMFGGNSPARASFSGLPPSVPQRSTAAPLPGRDTFRSMPTAAAGPVDDLAPEVALTPVITSQDGSSALGKKSLTWMESSEPVTKRPALGTFGVVALTVTVMVAVFLVATQLMGQR
jgi:serine/threonine-protein kinase